MKMSHNLVAFLLFATLTILIVTIYDGFEQEYGISKGALDDKGLNVAENLKISQ